jgi:hypothetical protein
MEKVTRIKVLLHVGLFLSNHREKERALFGNGR